ncbi:iron-siderophore ABC transporter substrate-binding protein [Pseudonocardiaceae bacterium YIM PH 21723]|nr:iron-siderophore ABC transporter substrate-binding protein [Pseudonocardiaceae bacterium YIM PH 21723]
MLIRQKTVTRRAIMALAAVAVGAGLLTGCDSSADNASGGAAAGGTFPVTVDHFFGSTTIKEAPKKIVAVGYTDDQAALALGAKPVGMTDQYTNPAGKSPDINTQWPWTKDKWGDSKPEVVMVNGDTAPNFEKIAKLDPDLIIAVYSEIDQASYDKLTKLAPTVARTKAEKEPFSAPWQDNALQISKALGKEDEGKKQIQAINDKQAAVKKAHPEWAGQSAVAVTWYKDAVYPYTSTDVRGQVLSGFGFKGNPDLDKLSDGKFSFALSPERMDVLSKFDHIIVIADKADEDAIKKFQLFTNLPAVKAGKVIYVPDSEGAAVGAAISQATLASMPYAIDQFSQLIK